MKYFFILITTVFIAFLTIPRSYEVSVSVRGEEVVESASLETEPVSSASSSRMEVEMKPHVTDALELIPNDEEWAVIASKKHATVIAQIYRGESSYGRFDACRARGQYNGFGYMESVTRLTTVGPYCFASFDEVVTHVDNWIEARIQEGFNENEMNCYYVRGIRAAECNTAYKLASTK